MKFNDEEVVAEAKFTVPADWYDLWLNYPDLFLNYHIGYWARQVAVDPELGRLAWEFEDDDDIDEFMSKHRIEFIDRMGSDLENEYHAKAIKAFKEFAPLPPGYHVVNKNTCTKAYVEMCKRRGIDWYQDSDANDYDVAFQLALLGEIKYG